MQDRGIWLLALATIAVSVGTSAAVVKALAPTQREPERSVNPRDDTALTRELSLLRAFLEESELQRSEPSAPAPATRRLAGSSLDGGDSDRLVAAIERLELAVREEHANTRLSLVDAAGKGVSAREVSQEIAWDEWHDLWRRYQSDEEAVRDQLRMITIEQLLARFGRPTEVSSRENGFRMWYYYEPDGSESINIQVQILDGYVTNLWIELP